MQQRVGILSPRDRHGDPVPVLYQLVVGDGSADGILDLFIPFVLLKCHKIPFVPVRLVSSVYLVKVKKKRRSSQGEAGDDHGGRAIIGYTEAEQIQPLKEVAMQIFDITVPLSGELPVFPGDPPVTVQPVTSLIRGDAANVARL